MNKEILFSENQRFKQLWCWVLLLGMNGLFIFGAYKQVVLEQQFGDKPMSDEGLLLAACLSIIFTVLFINFRLETLIKQDGIYVRFFPFHFSFRHYPWHKISRSFVKGY